MKKEKCYVCALNFGDEEIKDFALALDPEEEAEEKAEEKAAAKKKKARKKEESWKSILCTGWERFGGSLPESRETLRSRERVMELNLMPYSAVIYEVEK